MDNRAATVRVPCVAMSQDSVEAAKEAAATVRREHIPASISPIAAREIGLPVARSSYANYRWPSRQPILTAQAAMRATSTIAFIAGSGIARAA
jgi:hypothetical protein